MFHARGVKITMEAIFSSIAIGWILNNIKVLLPIGSRSCKDEKEFRFRRRFLSVGIALIWKLILFI